MKYKNIHERIEDIARRYLGIDSLKNIQRGEFTTYQVEKALKAAFSMGEKLGYSHGFKDAKEACNCSFEHIEPTVDEKIEQILTKW